MLIVRDRVRGMGDARAVLRQVGTSLGRAAKQTGQAAVKGAGDSVADKLRSWLTPSSGARGGGRAAAPNYLPWVIGGAAVLGLGYVVLRR